MTTASPPRAWRFVAPLLICAVTFAVYSNSLRGEFVFDDLHSIVESPHIRSLWPLSSSMSGEPGSTVSGRPIPAFSFALNYAAGGLDVFGYHLVNVALHALAALALFGLVRRTLERSPQAALARATDALAFVVALLWALHPLHTDALNHVSYRTETMMALFYLAALYCAARGFSAGAPKGWLAAAVACTFLAMGSKEAAVSLPLVVLLYERQFFAGSFAACLRRRGFYVSLAASWLLLVVLVSSGDRGTTVGFEVEEVSSLDYLRTQARGLLLYLRLAAWPSPLVFDYYGVPLATSWGEVWVQGLLILSAFAWSVFGVVRRKAWSVPALAVFAVLAPSSSFIPLAGEVLAEHRMVLPLAALSALVVVGCYRLAPRPLLWAPLGLAIAVGYAALTHARNEDYRTQESIWQVTVDQRPDNARALNNLFKPLIERGAVAEASAVLERSLELRPKSVRAWNNLGVLRSEQGQFDEAEQAFLQSLELRPTHESTHYNLAQFYASRDRWEDALEHYGFVARESASPARGYLGLGQAYLRLERRADALVALRRALESEPRNWGAVRLVAWILATSKDDSLRDGPEALRLATALCASTPQLVPRQEEILAAALAENGRFQEALEVSEQAERVARERGEAQVARSIRVRARAYASGRAYRE
jgi:tetratricopeptide (TPR) repeat protein